MDFLGNIILLFVISLFYYDTIKMKNAAIKYDTMKVTVIIGTSHCTKDLVQTLDFRIPLLLLICVIFTFDCLMNQVISIMKVMNGTSRQKRSQ